MGVTGMMPLKDLATTQDGLALMLLVAIILYALAVVFLGVPLPGWLWRVVSV